MTKNEIIGAVYYFSNKADKEHKLYLSALKYRHQQGRYLTSIQLKKAGELLHTGEYLKIYNPAPIKNNKKLKDIEESQDEIIPIYPKGLKLDLKEYQGYGVGFLENQKGSGLIADDMGLGKTAQALAYLHLHPELRPALIIVPAFLKINWKKEIEKWLPKCDVAICNGLTSNLSELSDNITIINYEILRGWKKILLQKKFKIVIADEVHKIKNRSTQTAKAFTASTKNIPAKILLTGTPILNRPFEIFNALNILRPNLFTFWKFINRYCKARRTPFGLKYDGHENEEELNDILIKKRIMVRRIKSEVLKELPPKEYFDIFLDIDNRVEYNTAEEDLIGWLESQGEDRKAQAAKRAEAITRMGYLKRLAATGKLKASIEWIESIISEDRSLVIFATHKNVLDLLQEKFKSTCCRIDGSISAKKKDQAVEDFQAGKKKLIIGNITAMGVGWTLTAADIVAFIEYPWSPKIKEQAEDRIHRIGQTSESISVYNLIATDTIDEAIIKMLEKKNIVINKIVNGIKSKDVGFNFILDQLKLKSRKL